MHPWAVHRGPQQLPGAQFGRADRAGVREIAAQLFLSPRTIDYYLHKIFAKLGVRSRVELARRGTGPAGPGTGPASPGAPDDH